MVTLFLAVLLLVVFPAMLYGLGYLIKTQSKSGASNGRVSVRAKDPNAVSDWVRRPMRKWTW